ncbi:MAG: DUF2934 domain-containing protein [Gemmatimonas sp.]
MDPRNQDEIAKRAYAIWQREGQPDGRDAEHWRLAEQELASENASGRTDGPAAGAAAPPRKPTLVRSRARKSGT